MDKQFPSIFNDVIGPVMRGPSSSHVAGAARIASFLRQAAQGTIKRVLVDFDINGSLAESHTGHGTDMGFACGLLDMALTDSRVDRYDDLIKEAGIDLQYRILNYGAKHPNHYRMFLTDSLAETVSMDAVSTGGGMIEVIQLDGFSVSMAGDFYEVCMILQHHENAETLQTFPHIAEQNIPELEKILTSKKDGTALIELKLSAPLSDEKLAWLKTLFPIQKIYTFSPVLPTRSAYRETVPFSTGETLLAYNRDKNLEFYQLALLYESLRGNTTQEAVWKSMEDICDIMIQAAEKGLAGTEYKDRILHSQAKFLQADYRKESGAPCRMVPGTAMNHVIQTITAVMEAKSSMQVIVAAPTCGSCGCLPGTVLGLGKALDLPRETLIKGLLSAGLLGVIFTRQATFAAEVGGCQMECGAASGMTAAAVCQMMGGTAEQCLDAASFALQSLTGLACDPVANRVEVPCLNKNVTAGMTALSSANMILSGFDKVIPVDETIQAMYDIGLKLPLELRCTFGGLGKTKTSLQIRKQLEENSN